MANLLTLEDELYNQKALEDASGTETVSPELNPSGDTQLSQDQGVALGSGNPLDQVQMERSQGTRESETVARTAGHADIQGFIDEAYEEGLSVDDVSEYIRQRTEKGDDLSLREYNFLQSLMLVDGEINPYTARSLTNLDIFSNIINREIEANDDSTFRSIMKFLDVNIVRYLFMGAFEDLTFRTNREGLDISEAVGSMSPDEFREWAEGYIDDRKSEGIFSSDYIGNLTSTAEDAYWLGDNPMAGVNSALALIDVIPILKGIKGVAKTRQLAELARVRKPVDAVTVVKGEVEGAEAAAKLVDDVEVQVDEVGSGRTLPKDFDPVTGPESRVAAPTFREKTRKNIIVEKLEELNRKGSFGEYIPKAVLDNAAVDLAVRVASRVNDVALTTYRRIDEGSGDYRVVVRMGKDGTGEPFRLKSDAEAIAAQDPSLRVVESPRVINTKTNDEVVRLSDIEDGGSYKVQPAGWYIETDTRLNTLGLAPELERLEYGTFVGNAVNKVFGASTVRLGHTLGAKFLQAEAGQGLVADIVRPFQKTIRSVKGEELKNLDEFMTALRDGDYSHYREAPDLVSFEAMYNERYGKLPSQKVKDAYIALLDINDASWHIKATNRLDRVVAEGGVVAEITEGFETLAYRMKTQVPEGEYVLDLATGRSLKRSDMTGDEIVFKVPDTVDSHLYVTNVKSTRVAERVDVMPYNVGGPRLNDDFRWFIGSTLEQTLASGNKISSGFRTLMGSFGKQDAVKAVDELNAITRSVKGFMEKYGVEDILDLNLSKADADELGSVIRANNNWSKHVTDLEDLKKLAATYGFRFKEEFVAKARDEKVSIREAGQDATLNGSSFGELTNTRVNMKRGDTPLLEYGGKKAANASPIKNIADQFSSEVFGYANKNATQSAIVGWVKLAEKAEGVVKFPDGVPENDFLNRFLGAEVSTSGRFDDLAAQLREQQAIIKRRMNVQTELSSRWESFTKSATEAIFEMTGRKLDLTKGDPSGELMKVGFYSKFGFFNPDQFVLQAFHSLTIAGISPKHGSKGAALALPLAMLSSGRLTPAARKLALQRLSNVKGVDIEEIEGILKYIDDSGRGIVDMEVIELQTPQKFSSASSLSGKAREKVGQFLDTSTLFFKEGERVTRMTGIATAYLEHKAKRPNIDPTSPEGMRWIMNREQDLSFRMTSQSRSYAQSGWRRLPTQWLSFTIRAMENIAIGKNFTAGERIRMFLVMGPMFGLTGVGLGKSAGYLTAAMGLDPDDPNTVEIHNRIKYGLVDALLSELLDTETAYAQRVAPAGQLEDTFEKLFNEPLFATLLGPSGEIGNDMLSVALSAVKSAFGGRPEMVRDDLTQLVRNLSTVDKVVKVNELIESGNYRSRTSKLTVTGLDENAAAAVIFGATPAPVQNFYDYQEMSYKASDKEKKMRKDLEGKAALALSLLTEGDQADILRGKRLWDEIIDQIDSSSFSRQIKMSLKRGLLDSNSIPDILRNALRVGGQQFFEAELLEQQRR